MRAAFYARVPKAEQAEKHGLDAQRTAVKELAAARGHEIVAEFVDGQDQDASGTRLDLPELQRLLAAVRQRAFDVVLALDPDRLARELLHHLLIERDFTLAGVGLEYVTVRTDDSPAGRLQRQVLGAIAEFERHKIIARTVGGKRERARKGKATGGPPPFGYRYDDTQPGGLARDDERADVLRRMFD